MSWRYRDISQRPIGADWPSDRPRLTHWEQKPSPFSAAWPTTKNDLELELRQLDAERVVLQIDVEETDFRLDGELRAHARRKSSAVIVSFDSKHGPVRMACDAYRDWESNARAIALSLKALRAVDRYGVTKRGEQYQGWRELPATGGLTSTADAQAFLDQHGGLNAALKTFHPDNPETGDRAMFDRVMQAKARVA